MPILSDLLGRQSDLSITRFTPNGAYLCPLDDVDHSIEILLPRREVADDAAVGDVCHVFVYTDSEDRPVATYSKPLVQADEVAYLQVVAVNRIGGFFDWGLPKDLLVPFREQTNRLDVGQRYLVYAYLDEASQRLVATMNIPKFIKNKDLIVAEGDQVQLIVASFEEIGVRVVVNHRHWGMVYGNQIFQSLRIGQALSGFVHKLRDDQKLDIVLQAAGYDAGIDTAVERVKMVLKQCDGFLPLTDSSDPEAVYAMLQMSKKQFKKAVGALYRLRLITIEDRGIRLL